MAIKFTRNLAGVKNWLLNAKVNPKASVNWYITPNGWEKAHGGGTSIPPNCVPRAKYSPGSNTYYASVRWLADEKAKDIRIIGEDHSIPVKPSADGSAPTLEQFYDALIAAVDSLIENKK